MNILMDNYINFFTLTLTLIQTISTIQQNNQNTINFNHNPSTNTYHLSTVRTITLPPHERSLTPAQNTANTHTHSTPLVGTRSGLLLQHQVEARTTTVRHRKPTGPDRDGTRPSHQRKPTENRSDS